MASKTTTEQPTNEKVDAFAKKGVSSDQKLIYTALGLELRVKFIQAARAIVGYAPQGKTGVKHEKGCHQFKWDGHHARVNWGADSKNGTDGFEDCTCIFITLIGAKLLHPISQKAMHPTVEGQVISKVNCVVDAGEIRVWMNMTNSFWAEVAELTV